MPEILLGIILEFFEMLLGLLFGLRDRKKNRRKAKGKKQRQPERERTP